jgi:hypothetical protein
MVLTAGQVVRITDLQGRQPGDLVAFNSRDLTEKFSQARTRVENQTVALTTGHLLWSNANPPRPMFTVLADSFGGHDLLYAPCCRYALERRFDLPCDGCLEQLVKTLAPWGLRAVDLPDPLNIFFRVGVETAGRMAILPADSQPGATLALRAEMDCLVAVSTCPVPRPGKVPSGYLVEVTQG